MHYSTWPDVLPRAGNQRLEKLASVSPWFEVYKVSGGTFALLEPSHYEEVISYLILGNERAILFDTGMGVGNIQADPLFWDAVMGDFELRPNSPCIDAGDPASPADPDGSVADMGALPHDPGHCPPATGYCTAGTTSSGCAATMSAVGGSIIAAVTATAGLPVRGAPAQLAAVYVTAARMLDVTTRTVERDWKWAQAWLRRELGAAETGEQTG